MLLAFAEADHWRPGIGDPTVMGWMTVVAYFTAAALCWMAGNSDRRAHPQSGYSAHPRLWFGLAALLAVLGFNKQLDLQTWFTLALKSAAKAGGWYEERRVFQALFICAMILLGIIGLAILCLRLRKSLRETSTALVGSAFLTCFVVIRAASFHHVDQMIGLSIGGFRLNWAIELGGIFCIGLAAWRNWRHKRPVEPACRNFVWVRKPESAWRTK